MSYTQNNKNVKEEYNYSYITITTKEKTSIPGKRRTFKQGKKYPILRIYVYPECWQIHDKLQEICRREGTSISQLFWKWAERYVRLHSPGNPQQTLDRILKEGKPYRAPKQCIICGRPATRKALTYNEEWVPLCKFCLAKNMRYIRSHVPIEKQTGKSHDFSC